MATLRTIVELPEKLAREIDAMVGEAERGQFLIRTAEMEVRRQRLLHFLEHGNEQWKDEDHPEFAGQESAAWVRQIRSQTSVR
jgi:hypothetical protein